MIKRYLLTIVILLFSLTIKVDNALAVNTITYAGTLDGSDATMAVVSISTPNCFAQGASLVPYEVHAIPSNTGGGHTFTLTSSGNFASMYLYVDSFNPASPLTNCVAAVNSGAPKVINYTLDASRNYFLVVFDDRFTPATLTYQVKTTIPQTECVNTDNRLNSACDYPEQAASVYCSEGNIVVYAVYEGKGYPAFTVTPTELEKFSGTPAKNILIKQKLGARLYKLTTGQYQVNRVKPDGKEYAFIFKGC